MKRFQFSLEKVERWRAIQAQVQKARTQQAIARVQAARMEIETHRVEGVEAAKQITEGGDPAPLHSFPGFRERSAKQSRALQTNAQRMEQLAAVELRRLTEMDRAHRLLENLHEDQRRLWEEDLRREEDAFAGEAFLARVQSRKRARSSVG